MFGPLCVSIAEPDLCQAARQLSGLHCAELRLDVFERMPERLSELTAIPGQCLLSCRPSGLDSAEQHHRLSRAIETRPALIDLDMDACADLRRELMGRAARYRVELVLSKHWFEETPPRERLNDAVSEMLSTGCAVVKVAAMCRDASDLALMLGLYSVFPTQRHRLLVLGMGALGALARLTVLQLGAPFTFVAPERGGVTAPGQLRLSVVQKILREVGAL